MKISQKKTCNFCEALIGSDWPKCQLGHKIKILSGGDWHGGLEIFPLEPCCKPKTKKELKYLLENMEP